MNIDSNLARAFNKAVTLSENIRADGSINWNFVDADVYMAVKPDDSPLFNTEQEGRDYLEQFDYLACLFDSGKTKAVFDATPSQYADLELV